MDIKEHKAGNYNTIRHPWETARFHVITSQLEKYIKKSGSVIADIGCGDAFIIERLSDDYPNIKLYGIDTAFDSQYIENQRANYKENVTLLKSINELSQQNVKADIILLLDVIEHVEDVPAFLSTIRMSGIIHDKTILIVSVPSFSFLYVSRDKWLGHYRRYSVQKLNMTMKNAGFIPVHSFYFFWSLLIPRMFTRISEYFYKPSLDKMKGIGGWKENKLLDPFIKNILIMDFKISTFFHYFGIRIPGLSCLTVCKIQ